MDGDRLAIGALTRHVDLLRSDLLVERLPVFRDAEEVVADPVVRNRGRSAGPCVRAIRPRTCPRGPVDHKRHLAGVLTQRALSWAAVRALGQEVSGTSPSPSTNRPTRADVEPRQLLVHFIRGTPGLTGTRDPHRHQRPDLPLHGL